MIAGLPPICPVAWPKPENTGAGGAAGAAAGAGALTKAFPNDGLPPICPVACPNPENPAIGALTGATAGASPPNPEKPGTPLEESAAPNPENPGTPLEETAAAGGGFLPGRYPARACPASAVSGCRQRNIVLENIPHAGDCSP